MSLRVIISGGGTGGHIYPGIAIAEALKVLQPNVKVLFVGAEGKMEMEKVPKAGYVIEGLPIRGIQRGQLVANLALPFRVLQSLFKAYRLLKRVSPHVVVGTGGYASWAMLRVATWAGIPTLIQEQNGYAGLTNKSLAKSVTKICVAYPKMERFFPKEKLVFTGNPVRSDLHNLGSIRLAAYDFFGFKQGKPTLVVLGGSGGARSLNQALAEALPSLLNRDLQIIWQTGKVYFEQCEKDFGHLAGKGLYMKPFIYEMNYVYSCADVVVARAGALSISELALAGKPAILVPSPNVTDDHQTKNAIALSSHQAAILLQDKDLKIQFLSAVEALLRDQEKQLTLSQNIATFAKPTAASDIAAQVMQLAKNYGQ
ncbi:MAG: undecaprenyldiphospho-muramoylpentapeptide beta-N-acetylglucosaminyltransferase [Cytophagales bacterium]|nr:MAG: undecaprenyldiphospho-muramoylpentapeptide beta-N-acetylglucosaminyltransferase [Cytophagales bacterium]TAF59980.1 MAG: undecaprenyldiphospho-muramoylpentapeptide beta-N-acetylglucosaminyltransferase [Cytophagales bacterium]